MAGRTAPTATAVKTSFARSAKALPALESSCAAWPCSHEHPAPTSRRASSSPLRGPERCCCRAGACVSSQSAVPSLRLCLRYRRLAAARRPRSWQALARTLRADQVVFRAWRACSQSSCDRLSTAGTARHRTKSCLLDGVLPPVFERLREAGPAGVALSVPSTYRARARLAPAPPSNRRVLPPDAYSAHRPSEQCSGPARSINDHAGERRPRAPSPASSRCGPIPYNAVTACIERRLERRAPSPRAAAGGGLPSAAVGGRTCRRLRSARAGTGFAARPSRGFSTPAPSGTSSWRADDEYPIS